MNIIKGNLPMPIAIIIAGIAVAGAIIYSNNSQEGNSKAANNNDSRNSGELVAGVPSSVIDAVGIDTEEFAVCMERDDIAEKISLQNTIATSLGLRGTPHSIVMLEDGTSYRINGAYPYDVVAITVEAALAGVNAETIQGFLDLFQAQGTTQETINAYAQENLIPAIAARQSTTTPALPPQESAGERLPQDKKDLIENAGRVLGNVDAPVQIVEFSDPECPYCAQYHTTMNKLMTDYEGSGELSRRHIHFFPLDSRPTQHPNARAQAEGAECTAEIGGEDKYWGYLDEIFAYNSAQ